MKYQWHFKGEFTYGGVSNEWINDSSAVYTVDITDNSTEVVTAKSLV